MPRETSWQRNVSGMVDYPGKHWRSHGRHSKADERKMLWSWWGIQQGWEQGWVGELGPFQPQSSWEWGFLFEQFHHYFRLWKTNLFHLWTESEILHFTGKLMNLGAASSPWRWFPEHEGKSSLVEDPHGKEDVTSGDSGELIHPDPANMWTWALFKTCISMCLLWFN